MKYLKNYNENNGLEDLEDCYKKYLINIIFLIKSILDIIIPNINMFPLNDI